MARIGRTLMLFAVSVALIALSGCQRTESGPLDLTGSVVDDSAVVRVPSIPSPAPETLVGFESDESTPSPAAASSSAGFGHESMWLKVTGTPGRVGDRVNEGDVVVTFEDGLLVAGVACAEADAEKARADLALLGTRLDEASEGLEGLEDQRSELETTVADLEEQRDDLLVQLEAARKLVGTPVPTGTPDPAETVVQLETAIEEIDTGLDEAREALTLLDETGGVLGDAVTAIEGAQKAARAMVRGKDIAIEIAEAYLARAQVKAPVGGVIVEAPRLGSVMAPGAPLLTIRPTGATSVRTWITAEQRERISLGASALVRSDSMPESLDGAVSDIGIEYEYAPTTFATKIIHLSRVFEVTVIVYGDDAPPPGTPVDVSIQTLNRLGS